MIAGFDWWLLLVGIVGGAGLVWLVLTDFHRRDDDVAADEQSREAEWIAGAIAAAGRTIGRETIEDVLRLHRAYLAGPVPDADGPQTEAMEESAEIAGSGAGNAPTMERHRPQP